MNKQLTQTIILIIVLIAILLMMFPGNVEARKVVTISAGGTHALALMDDGTVYAWGSDMYGQLGTGGPVVTPQFSAPHRTLEKVLIDNVTAVSAGWLISLALKDDGTVWAWGCGMSGLYGGLSNGDMNSSSVPVQVKGLTDITAISTGNSASYALKNDGTVWAWGVNKYGSVGDGTTEDRRRPVQVTGLTDIVALGERGNYAIRGDGTVWAWGYNTYDVDGEDVIWGILGDTSGPGIRPTPFQVQGVGDVTQIPGGTTGHTLYIKKDGSVWAWGLNNVGQLGDGNMRSVRPPPVTFPSVRTQVSDVKEVSTGGSNCMALKNDGTVYTWANLVGDNKATPTKVKDLSNVVDISAGGSIFDLALKDDGSIWGWGWDQDKGVLGNNKEKEYNPVLIFPGEAQATPTETQGTITPVTVTPGQSPGMGFGTILAAAVAMIGAYAIIDRRRKK